MTSIGTIQGIWFGMLGMIFYVAMLVIASAIVGFSFEWGGTLFHRWHSTKKEEINFLVTSPL